MKIGIVGSGSISENFLKAIEKLNGISCTAICSRKPSKEKANKLAGKYKIKDIYFDYKKMLLNPEINFIYIAIPNSLHYEYTLKALESNKNVICEKPFTTTLEQLDNLIKISQQKDLYLFEAITTIHFPNFKELKKCLPKIGKIKLVQCNFSKYSSKYDDFLNNNIANVFNPKFSGGALYDINIYNIHFIVNLFGKPKYLNYFANKASNNIDTSGTAVLKYESFICVCNCAKDSESPSYAIIQGENGYIKVNSSVSLCENIIIKLNKEESRILNFHTHKNIMCYELNDFLNIYKNNKMQEYRNLLIHSRNVMESSVRLRNSANIVFSDDK